MSLPRGEISGERMIQAAENDCNQLMQATSMLSDANIHWTISSLESRACLMIPILELGYSAQSRPNSIDQLVVGGPRALQVVGARGQKTVPQRRRDLVEVFHRRRTELVVV